mmetsp:Transcript_36504/g.37897  ORF Transcript_36504/g.37897 Transcript_36504/m.37897 type:complete len:193 (+) Transcript_36504:1150-1728(+)
MHSFFPADLRKKESSISEESHSISNVARSQVEGGLVLLRLKAVGNLEVKSLAKVCLNYEDNNGQFHSSQYTLSFNNNGSLYSKSEEEKTKSKETKDQDNTISSNELLGDLLGFNTKMIFPSIGSKTLLTGLCLYSYTAYSRAVISKKYNESNKEERLQVRDFVYQLLTSHYEELKKNNYVEEIESLEKIAFK